MLLEVYYFAKIRIYKNTNNTFTLFQTLSPSDGSSHTLAGAITDDHEWVVFGTRYSTRVVDVYKFDGEEYKLNQTIVIGTYVRSIALTQDHSFLVVGTSGYYVYVYKHNGTQFNHLQNFTYSTGSWKFVSITDDHQYLTVAGSG